MTGRRVRSLSLLFGLAFSALALVSWSQTWFIVSLAGASSSHPDLEVAGDVSAPALAALALAAAAGFAAMTISGRFFRVILALLHVALGASIVLSAALALASPMAAVEPAVTEATSIAGAEAVSKLVDTVTLTAWPFLGLVSGVLLSILGVAVVATGRLWPVSGRRYQTVRLEVADQEGATLSDSSVSDWDELSGGADPTSR